MTSAFLIYKDCFIDIFKEQKWEDKMEKWYESIKQIDKLNLTKEQFKEVEEYGRELYFTKLYGQYY